MNTEAGRHGFSGAAASRLHERLAGLPPAEAAGIRYLQVAGDASDGLPLILLHGIGSGAASWLPLMLVIGSIVPHVTRLLVGPQHRRMMPVAALLGASFLVLADTLSRSLSSTEIPVGIMTELAGALSLLAVLHIIRRYLW